MEDLGFPGRVGGRARPKDDKYQGNIKRQISKENWTKYQKTNIKETPKDKYQGDIKRQIPRKYEKKTGQSRIPIRNTNEKGW